MECLYRIRVSIQLPQVFKRLQERRPRTFIYRWCPAEKPGTQHRQDEIYAFEQAVGAVEAEAYPCLLSCGFDRTPPQQCLQKRPCLPRAETIAEQALTRAQALCAPAPAKLRPAAYTPRPHPVSAPVIKITVNEAVPSERTARTACRTAHRRQTIKKVINPAPALKKTFHCHSINRLNLPLNRKRG